ncbi:MAG TPA: glycosyltransferase family A protein, partial [Acetobacteraceae bacterium]
MAETVSVIIPAYNAATHIKRAVDSALAQTHPPLEILVVDDGSKDRTAEVVAALPAPVRLIRKPNGGPATARNLGASQASGDWLALLDADDWWFPDKLKSQLAFGVDAGVGMVHCLPDHRNDQVPDRLTFAHLWARNWIINSSVLIRRTAFDALGGFNEAKELISVEDYNLWIRAAASAWRIVTCPEVLVHYTRGIGISSNSERFMRASLFNVDDIGRRLNLPEPMVRRKRTEIVFDFGRKALFERDLPTARQLLGQTFKDSRTVRHGAHLLVSMIPEPVLDIRRTVVRHLRKPAAPMPPGVTAAGAAVPGNEPDWFIEPANRRASIVDHGFHTAAREAALERPVLVTTIDAEEDFDWNRPFSRAS